VLRLNRPRGGKKTARGDDFGEKGGGGGATRLPHRGQHGRAAAIAVLSSALLTT
jgi:hypothetical protein